ncbi:MAG: hypothetical protein GY765_11815, partial [bacterium]|nr:hypothetical protein [bacterium]
ILIMVFLYLFTAENTHAQSFPYRLYTMTDGIPATIPRYIYQDSKGFLLVITSEGLTRFDGIEFKDIPGTKNERITTVFEDTKGNLWIGTLNRGVIRRRGGISRRYTVKEGLPGNLIYTICEGKNGELWFGSGNGIGKFDGRRFTKYTIKNGLPSNVIYACAIDKDGNPWFGTDKGLSCLTDNGFVNHTTADGLLGNKINQLMTDSKGHLWIIVAGKGVNCYREGTFHTYQFEFIYQAGIRMPIARREIAGLDKLQLSDHTIQKTAVTAFMEDRRGTLWFVTNEGVSFLSGEKFLSPFAYDMGNTAFRVRSIREDRDGNIWIGNTRGLLCLHSLKVNNLSISGTKGDQLKTNFIWAAIQDRDGQYWFATDGGLIHYSSFIKKRLYSTEDGLLSERVYGLMEDRQGNIWAGTERG